MIILEHLIFAYYNPIAHRGAKLQVIAVVSEQKLTSVFQFCPRANS